MNNIYVWTGSAVLLKDGNRLLDVPSFEKIHKQGALDSGMLPMTLGIVLALDMMRNPGSRNLDAARQRLVHVALAEGCDQRYLELAYKKLKKIIESSVGRKDRMAGARVSKGAKDLVGAIIEKIESEHVSIH